MSGRSGTGFGADRRSVEPAAPTTDAPPVEADASPDLAPTRFFTRGRIFLGLRMVASLTMLGLLLTRFDLSVLNPIDELSSRSWIVARARHQPRRCPPVHAPLAPGAAGHRPTHRSAAASQPRLAGMFVSNFLPSTVGGDVLRVTRLSAGNGQRQTSLASVVVERLTGFLVLPFITLVALVGNPPSCTWAGPPA